jgi:hypothetical protein
MIRFQRKVKTVKGLIVPVLVAGLVLVSGCDEDDDPPPTTDHVKVFITSGAYTGRIPGLGLDAADTTCTTVAAGAGLTGTWTAWLSDNTTDAANRINDGGGVTPFKLINGTVVANSYGDLVDGTLDAPILIDESGNDVVGGFEVWTATSANGTNSGVDSCLEWTTNDVAESGRVGLANQMDANWTDTGVDNTCDVFNRLYCFADAISNDDIPPPVAEHVKVFITSGAYTGRIPGLGLAAADTACTDVADTAGLTGTWTAWLSDNTTDAVDRIFDGAVPYQLINGTIVANNLTDLTDGTLDSPILIDESGNVVTGNLEVWTATSANGTNPGVASCLEWTTSDVAESGRVGRADEVDANWTDTGVENTCEVFNRLYCFADAISN